MNDIDNGMERLESYSGLQQETARVYAPRNLAQLRGVFALARNNKDKHRVTLRGGGHAFDSQSLNNDLVVSMKKLKAIKVLEDKAQVCVEAGATWGEILDALKPHGLVPLGTVTTSHATAGGTLSADCLSRFSPRYGKESAWVERFSLLTIKGDLLECTRPKDTAVPRTPGERAFMATIGGFGYLGAIVDITFKVHPVGPPPIGMLTRIRNHNTFAELANDLVPTTRANLGQPGLGDEQWDAIWAGLYPGGRDTRTWMLFTAKFTTERDRRRLLMHEPNSPINIIGQWLMRVPPLCALMSRVFFFITRNGPTYIDDLDGFMFFMDGTVNATRIARRFGIKLRTIQQTFIVPVSLAGDQPGNAERQLVKWLAYAHDLFSRNHLWPTLQDVLFLPDDLAFCLSPNARSAGFAVSYAFESGRRTIGRVKPVFTEMAEHLATTEFGGRVSLVKNVCASADTLNTMYRSGAAEFFDIKQTLDPDCILRNEFLERTFPDLMPARCRQGDQSPQSP